MLIHSEFQISRDPKLAERIFRYNSAPSTPKTTRW